MFIAHGQDIHQTDTATGVFDDSAVDLGEFVVQNVANFTCGFRHAEDITNHEGDGHAMLQRMGTWGWARDPNRGLTRQGPASWHGQALQVVAAHLVQLLSPVNFLIRRRSDSSS